MNKNYLPSAHHIWLANTFHKIDKHNY